MSLSRNWRGIDTSPIEGQAMIHDMGWLPVLVKRTVDTNQNVGVSAELDEEEETFEIKGRIDPSSDRGTQDAKLWIGLVEDHILPIVRKNDRWFTQKPNENRIEVYRVLSINGDEILLTREY